MSISDLPEELKQSVFSYLTTKDILSSVCKVSRDFRRLGLRSVRHLDLDQMVKINYPRFPTANDLKRLVNLVSSGLRSVRCPNRGDASLFALHVLRTCPNLKALRVSCQGMKAENLFCAIAEHGHSLREIRLECLDFGRSDQKALGLSSFLNLSEINLSHCDGLCDGVLKEIGEHCPQLEVFEALSSRSRISDLGMKGFLEGVKRTIKKLRLDGRGPTDESFQVLGQCLRLECLHICEAIALRLEGLCAIVQLPRLRILNLSENRNLSDNDYRRAFARRVLSSLEQLTLRKMGCLGNAGLAAIGSRCSGLVSFEHEGNEDSPIGDLGMRSFLEGVSTSIKELNFEGGRLTNGSSFRPLADCHQLESLRILNIGRIGEEGLKSILQSPKLESLRIKETFSLPAIEYQMAFARRTTHLRTLELRELVSLDDGGLIAIAESCPELRRLVLRTCEVYNHAMRHATDVGVRAVVKNCGQLRSLEVVGYPQVTKAAFKDIRVFLPHLETIVVEEMDDAFKRELNDLGIVGRAGFVNV